MRRRTQIVLAITFMVAVLVSLFSYLHISYLLLQEITTARENTSNLASELAFLADEATPDLTSTRINTSNPVAVSRAITYYLSTDTDLNAMVQSMTGNWSMIYDVAIVGADGKAILHSNPDLVGKLVAERPDFQQLQTARFRRQLRMVYNPPTVYEVRIPLELNGAPFGSVRLGISTVFLRHEITPRLRDEVIFSAIAILLSLILAAGLSRIALGPLEHLSHTLDIVSSGDASAVEEPESSKDEYGLVTLKIAHLGRQMRDTREIFSALKDNVDQIMANLQDGLMLFTPDSRVVLVSASVERFLGRPRHDLLGHTVKELFSSDSPLGALVLDSFQLRHGVAQREVEAASGRRIHLSLDFIQERGTSIGALLTFRDAESVRRIGDEIETSRRMSASSRITRGVAHEVKNPINAIVLHLQLLRNKLQETDPDTRRHMEIIGDEIHRLDRVVQILVDFARPRDLLLEEIDLRRLLEDVAVLAQPDAEQHGVTIARALPSEPLRVRVDTDFIKQAMLNVVLNGVQAMPGGGFLNITVRRLDDEIVTEICDQGGGIPPEVQEKIFELYFTTKKEGSGIGLAQAYQILQWHYGSIEFETVPGKGTKFRLRLPALEPGSIASGQASRTLSTTATVAERGA
jgi:signal transduction histidine kinase